MASGSEVRCPTQQKFRVICLFFICLLTGAIDPKRGKRGPLSCAEHASRATAKEGSCHCEGTEPVLQQRMTKWPVLLSTAVGLLRMVGESSPAWSVVNILPLHASAAGAPRSKQAAWLLRTGGRWFAPKHASLASGITLDVPRPFFAHASVSTMCAWHRAG